MSKPVTGTVPKGSVASFFSCALALAVCGLSLSSVGTAEASPKKTMSLRDLPGLMRNYGQKRSDVDATEQSLNQLRASRATTTRVVPPAAGPTKSVVATRPTSTRAIAGKSFALTERDITPGTPSDDREPVFSPNGDYIAFLSNRASDGTAGPLYHVWVMNRDGSSQRQVTGLASQGNDTRGQDKPSWSPNGNLLVYVDKIDANTSQLYVINPLTGTSAVPEQRTFNTGLKRCPIFSPSGQELIYAANVNPLDNATVPSYDLFSIAASGSTNTSQRLTGGTEDPLGDSTDDLNPVYSVVNANVLFFSSDRAVVGGAPKAIAGRRIWVMQSNGQDIRQISDPLQRPAGRIQDEDDFPTTSRTFSDSGQSSQSYERVAFQSNSLIDTSDTTADLNIWSLKVDSSNYRGVSTTVTDQPKELMVGSYNNDSVLQFDATTGVGGTTFADSPFVGSNIEGVTFGEDLNDDGVPDLLVCLRDALNGAGAVGVFDGLDGSYLGTLITGSGLTRPAGIYYDPIGHYVYVASGFNSSAPFSTNKVHRFSSRTGAAAPAPGRAAADFTDGTGVSAVNNGLEGVVLGPDEDRDGFRDLFVSVLIDNKINVYSGKTGSLIATFANGFIPTGSSGLKLPTGIAFNSSQTLLFVCSSGTDEVLVFSMSDQSLVRKITGLHAPEGIIFGPDGLLYVANFDSDNDLFSQGRTVNRFDPNTGDPMPAPGQTGAVFATSFNFSGAGYMAFTPSSYSTGGGGTGTTVPPITTIAESPSGSSAVLETNGYSSATGYSGSGLPGYDTASGQENNSDKSADREPSFARAIGTGALTSQIAFASQRRHAFAPAAFATGAQAVNDKGGNQFPEDGSKTHDIWLTQAADFTPPILLPQAAGNQLYPVVAPGPQAPFVTGLRRTYETGLKAGGPVDIALVLQEPESGIASVSVSLYDANKPQFSGTLGNRATLTSKVDAGLNISIAPELKAKAVSGFTSIPLQSYDDGPVSAGGHERQADAVEGDGIYYCETQTLTPPYSSDFYMDVSVSDIAGNSFTYDNIWGFSTKQFIKSGNSDLFVSDYTAGQNFPAAFDPSGDTFGFGGYIGNSRLLDLDPVESYYLTNPGGELVTNPAASPFDDTLRRQLASQTTFNNVDVWRVQCRGQVPESVIDAYAPTLTQQYAPADFANNKPNPLPTQHRQVAVATSSIIWASPYTGLVFTGPGTLADSEMQRRLSSFLSVGGRLFVSGSDVIYTLTNGGTVDNQFLTNELRAKWDSETGGELITAAAGAFGGNLETYPRTIVPFDPNNTWADASSSGAQYAADSIGTAGSGGTVTPAYTVNGKTVGQRVETDRGGGGIQSRLVFLSFNLDSVNRQYYIDPVLGPRSYDARARIASGVRGYFKTGSVTGTVVNKSRNQPIANFAVEVIGANTTYIAVTDANGTFTLLGLPEGGYTYRPALTTGGGAVNTGYFPGPVNGFTIIGGTATNNANLAVIETTPGSLSGRAVLKGTGAPFANSPVLLRSAASGVKFAQLAQTDAGGRYSFSGVPAGVNLEVVFNPAVEDIPEDSGLRPGYIGGNGPNLSYGRRLVPDTTRTGTISVVTGDSYVLDDGDNDTAADGGKPIVVNLNPSVNGLVQATSGGQTTPLKNVAVKLLQNSTSVPGKSATTDDQGRYIIDDVTPGDYTVQAVAADGTTVSVSITVGRTNVVTAPIITFFTQGVSGKVFINTDTTPATQATVELRQGSQVVQTTTDSKGGYVFTSVAAGDYTIVATQDGASASVSVTVVNGTDLVAPIIRILRQSFSGKVLRNNTTTGLANVRVDLKQGGTSVSHTTTDSQGRYSLTAPTAGTFTIVATYSGANGDAVSNSITATATAGEDTPNPDLVIFLQTIRGTVTLNGAGTVAQVTLQRVTGTATTDLSTVTSSATGAYTFDNVPSGNYRVSVTGGNATGSKDTVTSASVAVAGDGGTVTVPTLNLQTQKVSGTVLSGGQAASGATVQIIKDTTVVASVTSGSDGKFTLTGIAPGSYQVHATKGTLRSQDAAVTVARGADSTGITLNLVAQIVTGRVVSGGSGVSGALVQLLQGSGNTVLQSTTTGSDGSYSFGALAAGNYTAKATKTVPTGEGHASVAFTVATAGSAVAVPTITLSFDTLTGKVTVDGAAATGVVVGLYTKKVDGTKDVLQQTATTDGTGTYSFTLVAAGSYIVEASLNGDTASATTAATQSGRTVTVATLALVSQVVTGRVTLNGSSAVGVTVTLTPAGGTATTATTNGSGIYTFTGVAAGTYTVSASSGTSSDSEPVTVTRGQNVTVATLVLGSGSGPAVEDDFKPGQQYQFSIPYSDSSSPYVATTVGKALSLPPTTGTTVNYVLKRFDPVTQTYVAITDVNAPIKRGVGYTIDQVAPGLTVRIIRPTQDVTRLPTAVTQFDITLQLNPSVSDPGNGVNLIGFPFDPDKYAYALWSKTTFTTASGTVFNSLDEAVAAGVVAREIYTLSSDNSSYVAVTDDKILPFKAYFVQTKVNNLKATLNATAVSN